MAKDDIVASLKAAIGEIESGKHPVLEQHDHNERNTDCDCLQTDVKAYSKPAPDDDANAAFKKIVDLVNASDKSEKALRDRLVKSGFSQNAIEDSISKARKYGIVDDARFGEILVRSRIAQGRGSAGIVRELSEHDINPDDVPGWPFEYSLEFEDELNRALDVLGRKPPRTRNLRAAAYRKLMQKGYPSSIASSAARIWSEGLSGSGE